MQARNTIAPVLGAVAVCLTVVVVAGFAGARAASPSRTSAPRLPVYDVVQQGATGSEADALTRALGLRAGLRRDDGSIHFLSRDLFQRLPVKPVTTPESRRPDEDGGRVFTETFDLKAIRALRALPAATARSHARAAFERAGLAPGGSPRITHSQFSAFARDGRPLAHVNVDTQASWNIRLSGRRLVGPGAKAEVTFDGRGRVTHLLYALRRLEQGETVPLLSPRQADRIVRARLLVHCAGRAPLRSLRLRRRLVYWAPALDRGHVRRIVPHYQYDATALVGGRRVPLETVYLPAVADGAPKVGLSATAQGAVVRARTRVRGGTPPYTYRYESCTTTLGRRAGATTAYRVRPRDRRVTSDTVSVLVTDANGLTSVASKTVRLNAPAARSLSRSRMSGRKDTGADWVGILGLLWNTSSNVADFLDEMEDVSSISFSYGNEHSDATDIIDPAFNGRDSEFGDNVDLLWWQSHGDADGVVAGDADSVTYPNVKLGNGDLEWIVVHACQVLKLKDGANRGLGERWALRFAGLHMMFGFSSNAKNVDGDGNEFGDNIADDDMRMRSAFVDAVLSEQPGGVRYRYMGVLGPGNTTNYNDYFHGIGPVSKDITTFNGYWYYDGWT
jgi:Family of unknown function (DUF6345)